MYPILNDTAKGQNYSPNLVKAGKIDNCFR